MNTPCNLPYFEIEAGTDGSFVAPAELQQIVDFLASRAGAIKDLFVMSHGWNNDMNDARSLYERFFTEVCNVLASHPAPGVSAAECAVVGILWPSKKFADNSVIPGGAAAVDLHAALLAALDHLASAAGPDAAARIAAAKAALPNLEDDPAAQRAFVDSLPRNRLGRLFRRRPGRVVITPANAPRLPWASHVDCLRSEGNQPPQL